MLARQYASAVAWLMARSTFSQGNDFASGPLAKEDNDIHLVTLPTSLFLVFRSSHSLPALVGVFVVGGEAGGGGGGAVPVAVGGGSGGRGGTFFLLAPIVVVVAAALALLFANGLFLMDGWWMLMMCLLKNEQHNANGRMH